MNTLLLITHAPLASALRQGVLHVFPEAAAHLAAVDVDARATPEATLQQARAALQSLPPAEGVLLLADMLGATPCNVARQLLTGDAAPPRQLLAGANLPMLLRAYSYRHESLPDMAARALAGGTQAITAVDAPAAQSS